MENERFSERLSELMANENLTTDKLAEKIGVDGSAVRLWKLGNSVFLSNVIKLSNYFDCSMDFLVGRSDTKIDFTPKPSLPFYPRLREIMKIRGVSTYRFLKDLKFSSSNLTNWKKGADPYIQTIIVICNYLGCTLDYLVGRDR